MRLENVVNHHDQQGNPDAAGEVIVDLIASGKLPCRLPLGSDAVRINEGELKNRLNELAAWEEYSNRTDY